MAFGIHGFITIPGTSTTIAYDYAGQILESNDRGATWSRIDAGSPGNANHFAVASDAATIYACGSGHALPGHFGWVSGSLARSQDGGRTWANLIAPPGNFGCGAITAATGSPDIAYLSLEFDIGEGIIQTRDGGDTWTQVPGTDAGTVTSLISDPTGPLRIVAAYSFPHYILAIDESSGSRGVIGDMLPATPISLALDVFASPPTLYVGTIDGVFSRPAVVGPGSWTMLPESNGLVVNELTLTWAPHTPTRRTLAAATSAGIQEFTLDTAGTLAPVYRLFNTQAQSHLFTASAQERNAILATLPHFMEEGIAFYGLVRASPFAVPVHRFYQPARGTHAYALTEAEREAFAALGDAVYEGIAYYVLAPTFQEPGTLAVHRFVNGATGGELFTVDDDERDDVRRHLPQFAYRGVAFTGYPASR